MKKGDIILCVTICLAAALLGLLFFLFKKEGKVLTVKSDNAVIAEYPISVDTEIDLKHNKVVIKNGKVYMSEADCKNQICVKTGEISKRGECIVCLPNKVVLEIK